MIERGHTNMQMKAFIKTADSLTVSYITCATYEKDTGHLLIMQGKTGWRIEMDEVAAKAVMRELLNNNQCDLSAHVAQCI